MKVEGDFSKRRFCQNILRGLTFLNNYIWSEIYINHNDHWSEQSCLFVCLDFCIFNWFMLSLRLFVCLFYFPSMHCAWSIVTLYVLFVCLFKHYHILVWVYVCGNDKPCHRYMHGSHWLSDKDQKSSRLEGPTDFKLMKISKQHELPKEAMHTCKQLIHQFCTGNELSWERYERNPKYIIYRIIDRSINVIILWCQPAQCSGVFNSMLKANWWHFLCCMQRCILC